MKTLRITIVLVVALILIAGTILLLWRYFNPEPAGLRIDTVPSSSVYVNGGLAGKTPLKKTFSPGTITLRLVPDSTSDNLLPYQTETTLVSGIETVVRREFGSTEDSSSGDVISFQKNREGTASLTVITTPDNAQVSIDGIARGFAPYNSLNVTPAEHQIMVKFPGYQDRIMAVNTVLNYQLTIFAKLAKEVQGATQSASLTIPTPATKTYVEILKTPTGLLRVRTLPGTAGEEIAQVKSGDKYSYLETDGATGWYKIQYEGAQPGLPNGIAGWVSNQYSQIATESGSLQ